jgi:outer membrane protein TolC
VVSPAPISPVEHSIEALVRLAMERRPEFAASVATANAQRERAQAAKWRFAPTLSAFGQAKVGNYASFTGNDYAWSLGLQLDWAAFDGGSHTAQAQLAQAQRAETLALLAAEQDTVRDAVANNLSNVHTKQTGIATAEQAATLAEETLRLIRAQYDAGVATQLDVLQAQDSLLEAEVTRAQANFDLALAKLSLDQSAGLFPEAAP